MSKVTTYLVKVNDYLKDVKWEDLSTPDYRKVVGENLMEIFKKVYGNLSISWRDCEDDEGFAYVPGLLKGNTGEEYVALLSICVQDSGEYNGPIILHPLYKILDDEAIEKKLSKDERGKIYPHKYRPLIYIEGDHHQHDQY